MLTIEAVWLGALFAIFVVMALLDGLFDNNCRNPTYPVISGLAGIAALIFFFSGNWTLVAGYLLSILPPGDELLRSFTVLLILGFGSFISLSGGLFLLSQLGAILRRSFYSKRDGHHE